MKNNLVLEIVKKFRKALNLNQGEINSRMQSMKDSQGKSDYSGSSYNGPGKPDSDKIIYNKNQRSR